jgi:hypothetical protein
MLADRLLGCPALPDRPLLPGTRPRRRLPGFPAVPGVAPESGTQSRYPSGGPVTRLSSRFPTSSPRCIRSRYPSGAPVARLSSRFPELPPGAVPVTSTRPRRRLPGSSAVPRVSPRIGTCYQVPVRGAGCPAPQPFPEFPPELAPDSRIPVRNAGCPAPRPFSEFPPGAVPVFSGDEFLQPRPDRAQEFSRSNFKIF